MLVSTLCFCDDVPICVRTYMSVCYSHVGLQFAHACVLHMSCVHMAGQPLQELTFALEHLGRTVRVSSMGANVAAELRAP